MMLDSIAFRALLGRICTRARVRAAMPCRTPGARERARGRASDECQCECDTTRGPPVPYRFKISGVRLKLRSVKPPLTVERGAWSAPSTRL
eukprot:1619444-Pleurochrysis_carterae.AAC.4